MILIRGDFMNIKLELLAKAISDTINQSVSNLQIDVNNCINTASLSALEAIKAIIQDDSIEEDFDVVEKIVCVFEKYNIYSGSRHDF